MHERKAKRIISLALVFCMVFNLIPFGSISFAKDLVGTVVATATNLAPEWGDAVVQPVFTVTTGEPAYVLTGGNGYWSRKINEEWVRYNEATFMGGTYKYTAQLRIDGDGAETHELAGVVNVTINETAWTVTPSTVEDTYSYAQITSPEMEIAFGGAGLTFLDAPRFDIADSYVGTPIDGYSVAANVEGGTPPYTFSKVSGPEWITVSAAGAVSGTPEETANNGNMVIRVTDDEDGTADITVFVNPTYIDPEERTQVTALVVTSNMATVAQYGEDVLDPTFNVTAGNPAYVETSMGHWYKKNGGDYNLYNEATFDEGIYQYSVQVRIDEHTVNNENGRTHVLATPFVATIDGNMWEVGELHSFNTYSYIYITSPDIEIEEPEDTFDITVNGGTAKIADEVVTSAAENAEVTIIAAVPAAGKVFDCWTVDSDNVELASETASTTTFTMPSEAVEVTATYKDIIQVESVAITGVTAPRIGRAPTLAGITVATEGISLVSDAETLWKVKESSTPVEFAGNFEYNKQYYIYIHVAADEGYAFANGCTFTINGEAATNVSTIGDDKAPFMRYDPLQYQQITITLDENGGEALANNELVVNETTTFGALEIPEVTNDDPCVTLVGWADAAEEGTAYQNDYVFLDNTTIYAVWGPNHDLTAHAAVAATCTAPGNIAYWECETCGGKFSDAGGTTAVDNVTIAKLAHTLEHHAATAATCNAVGNVEYWECTVCHNKYGNEAGTGDPIADVVVPINANAHVWNEGEVTTPATCTALGVRTYTCTINPAHTTTEDIPMVDHTLTEHHDAVPATCLVAGWIEYWKCSVCHRMFSDEDGENEVENEEGLRTGVDEVNGHIWDDGEVTTEPTCTAVGVRTYRCTITNVHSKTEDIPMVAHTLQHYPAEAATCSAQGHIEFWECTVCHNMFNNEAGEGDPITTGVSTPINAEAHVWNDGEITTPATCTAVGVRTYTCTLNGEHTTTEEIPMIAHTLEHHAALAATCSAPGNIEYWECTVCHNKFNNEAGEGEPVEDVVIPIDEEAHVWNDGEVTTPATCTAAGVRTYTCTINGEHTRTEDVDMLPHTLTDHHEALAATCSAAGNIEYWECTVCHKTFEDDEGNVEVDEADRVIPIDEYAHDYGDWTETLAATETEAGEETRTCAHNPAHTETRPIPPLGHTHALEHHEQVPATCTEDGNIEYWVCVDADPIVGCGAIYSDSLGNTQIGESDTRIPATGHTLESHAAVVATCMVPGNIAYWECTVCHDKFSDSHGTTPVTAEEIAIAADLENGHTWNEGEVTTEPTCSTVGVRTYTCTINGEHTKTEDVEMLPHTPVHVEKVEATTSAKGKKEHWKCSVCEKVFTDAECTHETTDAALEIPKKTSGGSGSSETTTDDTTYKITTEAGTGGSISPKNPTVAKKGSQKFTITAKNGYEIEDVLVDGQSVGAVTTYTLKNVTDTHLIEAKFTKIEDEDKKDEEKKEEEKKDEGKKDSSTTKTADDFVDVKEGDWYYDAVDYAAKKGLFSGVSEHEFAPKQNVTRGMLVTVLSKLAGADTSKKSGFSDVPKDAYYSGPVAWAAENGFVSGIGSNMFDPGRDIARQDLITILYKFAASQGVDINKGTEKDVEGYEDIGDVAEYAAPAIRWAVNVGLMSGRSATQLAPRGTATRAESAALMQKLEKLIK